jgi:hypothetical protein
VSPSLDELQAAYERNPLSDIVRSSRPAIDYIKALRQALEEAHAEIDKARQIALDVMRERDAARAEITHLEALLKEAYEISDQRLRDYEELQVEAGEIERLRSLLTEIAACPSAVVTYVDDDGVNTPDRNLFVTPDLWDRIRRYANQDSPTDV